MNLRLTALFLSLAAARLFASDQSHAPEQTPAPEAAHAEPPAAPTPAAEPAPMPAHAEEILSLLRIGQIGDATELDPHGSQGYGHDWCLPARCAHGRGWCGQGWVGKPGLPRTHTSVDEVAFASSTQLVLRGDRGRSGAPTLADPLAASSRRG